MYNIHYIILYVDYNSHFDDSMFKVLKGKKIKKCVRKIIDKEHSTRIQLERV